MLDAATLAGGDGANVVSQLNRKAGARTVVSGSYYAIGDSLQFRAQVSDAATGEVLSVMAPVTTPRSAPQAAFPLLRERVLGAIAVLADEAVPRAVGLRQRPPTYEAYRAFELGSQRFTRQDYAGAIPLLRQAHEIDTTFMVPLLNLISALWNEAEFDSVGTGTRAIARERGGRSIPTSACSSSTSTTSTRATCRAPTTS